MENWKTSIQLAVTVSLLLAACGTTGQGVTPVNDPPVLPRSTSTPPLTGKAPEVDVPLRTSPAPPVKGSVSSPSIGVPFWLAVGETAALNVEGTVYTLTFVEVTEDSRCPRGAQCIVAGTVGIKLAVVKNSADPVDIRLSSGDVGEPQPSVQLDAITLSLQRVVPLAAVGEAVDPAAYRLELLAEK